MPCLEVTLPRTDAAVRARLAAGLVRAVTAATPFPGDILGVRFSEYEPGEASGGDGVIWDGAAGRPYLHVVLWSPRLTRSMKASVVAGLTAAFTEAVGEPGWKPVIHLCEHPHDNVGVEGRLLSDSYPELRSRPFYYPLDDPA